jgi:hypothetical protein
MIVESQMIYTCYEMIGDCRAGRAEGWRYLVACYVPVMRKLLAHYAAGQPDREAVLERLLLALRRPESSIFQLLEPAPERWFVAALRQKVVAELAAPEAAIALDLETVAAALEPLTLVEKQVVWLESMLYTPAQTGVLLRMAPDTAEKIRAKGAGLVRGKVDSWSATLLAENGPALGRAALAAAGDECLPPKPFLDLLDGRTTWGGRGRMERHVTHCWHCIDHFCRLVEVMELLRGNQPLSTAEAAPFLKLLGVAAEKQPVWKRWLAGAS